MTQDEVQELIELTPEQEKAFRSLTRAVKRCEKENVYLYQVLDSLGALNGNNVGSVECPDDDCYGKYGSRHDAEMNLQLIDFPSVRTTDAFADDTHYVVLK